MKTLRFTPRDLRHRDEVEQFLGQIAAADHRGSAMTLDLDNTTFLSTSSILSLVTAARLWRRRTGQPLIVENLAPQIHAYLDRVNVFDVCGEFLQCRATSEVRFERVPESQRLLELALVPGNEEANSRSVREILRRAKLILQSWLSDETLTRAVQTMVAEIGQNVVHSEDCGYALIQRYRQPHTLEFERASEINIAVADLGIGIEESLARRHPDLRRRFQHGSQYILHAFEQGVSGKAEVRGIGLNRVADIVRQRNGVLTVRSYRSQVRFSGEEIESRDDLAAMPGVHVSIVVRGIATNGA